MCDDGDSKDCCCCCFSFVGRLFEYSLRLILKRLLKLLPRRFEQTDAFVVDDVDANDEEEENSFAANKTLQK